MIAVIPARGGSKGVYKKNIKMLNGKPLIAYTIEEALKSKVFEKVIVSTDDEEIADVSKEYGAEIPFIRPADISGDFVSSDEVIMHTINFFEKKGKEFEYVCKLQPTSPLRRSEHICEAYNMLRDKSADYVVSVCECEHSPLWAATLDSKHSLDAFITDDIILSCRQKLQKYYRLNGAIYMAKTKMFKETKSFFGKNGYAYIMNQIDSVDIDSELDFKIATTILQETY